MAKRNTQVRMELIDTATGAVIVVKLDIQGIHRGTTFRKWEDAWKWVAESLRELTGAEIEG